MQIGALPKIKEKIFTQFFQQVNTLYVVFLTIQQNNHILNK